MVSFSTHLPLHSDGYLELGVRALDRMKRAGIKVPRDNRLQRAIDRVRSLVDGVGDLDPPAVPDAHQTILEMCVISRIVPDPYAKLTQEMFDDLPVILTGSDDPRSARSRPRDLQFEYFVGAQMIMSGIPTNKAEPDWRIMLLDREVGVAAKRTRSPSKIRDNAMKAKRQVLKYPPGFIAMNLDLHMAGTRPEDLESMNASHFEQRLHVLERIDDRLKKEKGVLGRMTFGTDTAWSDESKPRFVCKSFFQWKLFDNDQRVTAFLDERFSLLKKRWEGLYPFIDL